MVLPPKRELKFIEINNTRENRWEHNIYNITQYGLLQWEQSICTSKHHIEINCTAIIKSYSVKDRKTQHNNTMM